MWQQQGRGVAASQPQAEECGTCDILEPLAESGGGDICNRTKQLQITRGPVKLRDGWVRRQAEDSLREFKGSGGGWMWGGGLWLFCLMISGKSSRHDGENPQPPPPAWLLQLCCHDASVLLFKGSGGAAAPPHPTPPTERLTKSVNTRPFGDEDQFQNGRLDKLNDDAFESTCRC